MKIKTNQLAESLADGIFRDADEIEHRQSFLTDMSDRNKFIDLVLGSSTEQDRECLKTFGDGGICQIIARGVNAASDMALEDTRAAHALYVALWIPDCNPAGENLIGLRTSSGMQLGSDSAVVSTALLNARSCCNIWRRLRNAAT